MFLFPLRQSTASQEIPLGPFLDSTDGNTQETGLTIANTDIKIWKSGGTSEASKNSGGATHIASGRYYTVLDATDTDTVGPLRVACHPSGALAVQLLCCVLPPLVYDSMFATAGAAPFFGFVDQGTAQSATASTLQLRSAAAFADDEFNGCIIILTGGTGVGQTRVITDYVSSTDTATVSPDWTTTPSGTITYLVIGAPPAVTTSSSLPAVNVTHFGGTAGTFSSGIPEVKVNNIAAGAVNAAAIATGAIDADALAADAIDEIHDEVIEGTTTFRQMMRGVASALFGKASGLATTTAVYRDIGDTKDRITATVDADGNRSAVTKDLT